MLFYEPFNAFHIGPLTLYTHGLMIGLGVIVAYLLLAQHVKKIGTEDDQKLLDTLILWGFLGGFLGARILYVVLNIHLYESFIDALRIWEGGLVSFGGMLGGILAGYIYLKIKKEPLMKWLDIATPYMLIGWAIGRVGSLLTWGTIGTESALPWAFKVGEDVARHPVQAYHTIVLIVLFIILVKLQKTFKDQKGKLTALAMMFYGAQRFFLEFFRDYPNNEYPFYYRNFAQIMSVLLIVGGLTLYMFMKEKRK